MSGLHAMLGIDPGVSGAAVLLAPGGSLVSAWRMPDVREDDELDALREMLHDAEIYANRWPGLEVCCEDPGIIRTGAQYQAAATRSLARNVGYVLGYFGATNRAVRVVAPSTWQSAIGILRSSGGKTRDTKAQAAMLCGHFWPTFKVWLKAHKWNAAERAGAFDAALIARYGLDVQRIDVVSVKDGGVRSCSAV